MSFNSAADENGILIYCARNIRGVGDFVALVIFQRHLKLQFGVGTDLNELISNYTIDSGKWYNVNIKKDYKTITLKVNFEKPVIKAIPSSLHPMTLKTLLYFGGVDRNKIIINENVKVKSTFSGCLDKVRNSRYYNNCIFKGAVHYKTQL